jgi:hypothetical protein
MSMIDWFYLSKVLSNASSDVVTLSGFMFLRLFLKAELTVFLETKLVKDYFNFEREVFLKYLYISIPMIFESPW